MDRIVLLGENIAHSRSPAIFAALFRKYGLRIRYELEPLGAEDIAAAITRMKRGGYLGANITSPHKERAAQAADRLAGGAARIGAINTIEIRSGNAIGHNTDIEGFSATLTREPLLHNEFSAAILGTGGAARAAAVALCAYPQLKTLTIYSRVAERAARVAAMCEDPRVIGSGLVDFVAADLLIQATPVGLPGRNGILLDEKRLEGVGLFYEMIYSPVETAQLRVARNSGIRGVNGERMLVEQALRSFAIWTGITASADDLPGDIFAVDSAGEA